MQIGQEIYDFTTCCSNLVFTILLLFLEHSKDALDLAQVQETTKQLEKQEKIKVCSHE